MIVKDVLDLWMGWDSPDVFKVEEISPEGRHVSCCEMTGLELVQGCFSERVLVRFGSYGKGAGGTWRHYVWVAAE